MKIYLHLEDGDTITGEHFGHLGEVSGEVVFTTGMTGYPQSLTDPSFAGQILVFTYPLIGNYGVPQIEYAGTNLAANFESEKIWVRAVVVGEYCQDPPHYRKAIAFSDWLEENKIAGIYGVDTRALTLKLREKGVMRGIVSRDKKPRFKDKETKEKIRLVEQASCREVIKYPSLGKAKKRVVLIDCGVKHGIIRALMRRGYEVVRIPYNADPLEIKNIDAVVCSNGPGDPKDCPETTANIKKTLNQGIPFLGICLGHQLLALAIGADTYKLKYGHRGLNQPCQDQLTLKAYITSQNHGYAVDPKTIPPDFEIWFTNLNDGTNEGIRHKTKKIYSAQFHPEGCPGPFDTEWIFGII